MASRVAQMHEPVAHHPRIGDIRDLLTFRIAMIAAAGDRVAQRWLGDEFALRLSEWRVLGTIAARQPIRFAEVARSLLIDKGQLSRLVNALAQRGLILAATDAEDLRTIRLGTTEEGRILHERVLARAFERNHLVVSALSQDELTTLFTLLDKLQPHMTHRAGSVENAP